MPNNKHIIILPWTPGSNWEDLSSLPMSISMGMCDDWFTYSWVLPKKMDVSTDDIFLIISPRCEVPSTPEYDWLRHNGARIGSFSGICFLGVIQEIDDEDDGKEILWLNILFGILPGMIENIELKGLKAAFPTIDWDSKEEIILGDEDSASLLEFVCKWLKKNQSKLEYSEFSNILNRDIDEVIEIIKEN